MAIPEITCPSCGSMLVNTRAAYEIMTTKPSSFAVNGVNRVFDGLAQIAGQGPSRGREGITPPMLESKMSAAFRARYQKDLKSICPKVSASFSMISYEVGRFLHHNRLMPGSGSFLPTTFTYCRFSNRRARRLGIRQKMDRHASLAMTVTPLTKPMFFGSVERRFSAPAISLFRNWRWRGQGSPVGRPRCGAPASLMPPTPIATLSGPGAKLLWNCSFGLLYPYPENSSEMRPCSAKPCSLLRCSCPA